jgi:hypothetical protein
MSKPNYLDKVLEQGGAIWNGLRLVQDNWQNVFTGLGTARDKTQYGRFVNLSEINDNELSALYHQNDTARRVVALKPQEMMRKGFAVNVEDDTEASSAIAMDLQELKAPRKIRDAMIWGRLFGGAVVIIGADDGGEADQPLNENTIKSIKFLHVVDKRHLVPDTWFSDPLNDEFFGEPQTYRVTPRRGATNLVVHRSRLLVFGGAHTTDEERDRLGGWDHSSLTAVYTVLRQFDNAWQAAEHLMSDASQAVFKIQGLMSMIAGGQKDVLATRMQLVDMSRSVARALLLDADGGEEFSREASSFTDAHSMLDKFMLRLAQAAETPVTILMGQSPAGMNATGESDFRWFYDSIATAQENELKPQLEKLVRIMMLAKDGPTRGVEPDVWAIKFAPLWQPTPVEQAELEKTHAEKDKIYLEAGVLLPEEVALSRYRPEGWSAETQIDREAREAMLEAEESLPVEPVDEDAPLAEPEASGGNVVLAPTDIAIVVTVNEARASQKLPPWPNAEEGRLTVAEFKARKEAEGAAVGEAEGDVAADEIDPSPDAKPPAFGAPSFGAPPVPPKSDESDESAESEDDAAT